MIQLQLFGNIGNSVAKNVSFGNVGQTDREKKIQPKGCWNFSRSFSVHWLDEKVSTNQNLPKKRPNLCRDVVVNVIVVVVVVVVVV